MTRVLERQELSVNSDEPRSQGSCAENSNPRKRKTRTIAELASAVNKQGPNILLESYIYIYICHTQAAVSCA